MTSSIGTRVREAIPRGMNQQMLAADIGMTPDALSRALNSQRHFSALELAEIARVLDQDLSWIITGAEDPFKVRLAARHLWDGGPAHSEANDLDLIDRVSEVYRTAFSTVVPQSGSPLPTTPSELRALLPEGPASTLSERLESALGIDIIHDPSLLTDYSMHLGGRPVILLKSTPHWFRANWSLAHELGHLALGHHGDAPDQSNEWPANVFAAEFWLPEDLVRRVNWATLSDEELAVWLWDVGVSTIVLQRRLRDLHIEPSEEVIAALELKTQQLMRSHIASLSSTGSGDPIWERENRSTGRRFPAAVVARLADRVASGEADPQLLAWVRDVAVDELDELWPDEDNRRELRPSPSDTSVDEWFGLVKQS